MSADKPYSTINVAVIGSGNWGKNHIRVFHSLGALYTICDVEPNRARSLCEQYDTPFSTFKDVLASKAIHACVIATPAGTHFELARQCLEAKKHIFIEKPMVLTANEAMALDEMAIKAQRIVMVGHLLHYHQGFKTLQSHVRQGALGKVCHITSNRFTFGKYSTEDNVLWDVAPHDVSIILSLMNEMPYQVYTASSHNLPNRTHDIASVQLYFSNNKHAQILCSWLHPIKEQKLTVIGDKAMAIFDDCQPWENKLQFFSQTDTLPATPKPIGLVPHEPLTDECQHFLDAIIANQAPLTNAKEALKVTQVLEAAVESAQTCQPIRLRINEY